MALMSADHDSGDLEDPLRALAGEDDSSAFDCLGHAVTG